MTGTDAPLSEDEFSTELARLVDRGERGDVSFDRSWTVRTESGTKLMVEITRLRSDG